MNEKNLQIARKTLVMLMLTDIVRTGLHNFSTSSKIPSNQLTNIAYDEIVRATRQTAKR